MVVQKAVDNLKERPKDERQAVALGTAGAVVLILIVIWGFFFLKGLRDEQIQSGAAFEFAEDAVPLPIEQTYQVYGEETQTGTDQFGLPAIQQQ